MPLVLELQVQALERQPWLLNEEQIRQYIREQEYLDKEQMDLEFR